ncbi:uncharacterized protein DUF2491 [Azospirillum brasilense]|uniref:DUF2491 family protein n=1 Tax=Azospirillum aestuarii TaxID=2802052 RepID=UPI001199DB03|nr:DUF2491 family protein [Azospirillum aestuarii]TWA86163.1 uncharacterized protein DUF2491 [Azospirillum brasilense]
MPIRNRIAARFLSLLLALAPLQPLPAAIPAAVPVGLAAATAALLWPQAAEARAGGGRSSSGGYSRPSVRTPSFSTRSAPSRAPSTGSGGYSRPKSGPSYGLPGGAPSGGGDLGVSRRSSGEALDRYRAQQQQQQQQQQRERTPPVAAPPPRSGSGSGTGWGGGGWQGGGNSGSGWGQRRTGGYGPGGWYGGWRPPGWAYGSRPSFGLWNGLFLWFLLDNLSRPGYADWFHNHQGDPGYAEWRAEAERRAQDDPDLRRRLDDLDTRLRAQDDRPRDPGYLPPDIPRDVAQAAPETPSSSGDSGGGMGTLLLLILLVGGMVVAVTVLRRRSSGSRSGGSAMTRSPWSTAAGIVKAKATGASYEPSLFRVGMTLTPDPTPFLLGGGAIKAVAPEGAGTMVSVEAVGTLTGGGVTLHRLYLPGGRGFYQLHLGAGGAPDECRWFSVLDEVHPTDNDEWGFWLDPGDGMIGYPQFQTKDGKLYGRLWSPGASRIAPITFDETLTDHRGSRTRRLTAMLYAAPTGAADPAPRTEYVLAAAVEDGGEAWVEVRAGIDVNPASLSLA